MADKNLKCKDEDKKKKMEKNSDVEECVNRIVIKPTVKIEINVSGMKTGTIVG